jgi:hypothetical protein
MSKAHQASEEADRGTQTAIRACPGEGEPTGNDAERVEDDVEGETFRTVFGSLLGVYTWECHRVPSDDEIQAVMEHRVQTDCARLHHRPERSRLAGWHGGWTTEGVGIFAADLWGMSHNGPARHLGRLSVIVRAPSEAGLSTAQGMAC